MSRRMNEDEVEQFDSASTSFKIGIGVAIIGAAIFAFAIFAKQSDLSDNANKIIGEIKATAKMSQPKLKIEQYTEKNTFWNVDLRQVKITSLESDTISLERIILNGRYIGVVRETIDDSEYNSDYFQSVISDLKQSGDLMSDVKNTYHPRHDLIYTFSVKLAMGEFIVLSPGNFCQKNDENVSCLSDNLLAIPNMEYVKIDISTDQGTYSEDLTKASSQP